LSKEIWVFPSLVYSPGNLRDSNMVMACPVTY
jgi:hypothetical protein